LLGCWHFPNIGSIARGKASIFTGSFVGIR
jgi:hypothetical protein